MDRPGRPKSIRFGDRPRHYEMEIRHGSGVRPPPHIGAPSPMP